MPRVVNGVLRGLGPPTHFPGLGRQAHPLLSKPTWLLSLDTVVPSLDPFLLTATEAIPASAIQVIYFSCPQR